MTTTLPDPTRPPREGTPWTIHLTVGSGRTKPQGWQAAVEATEGLGVVAAWLSGQGQSWDASGKDLWWSLHTFEGHYREAARWTAAAGVGVDVDYCGEEPTGPTHRPPDGRSAGGHLHAEVPRDLALAVQAHARQGLLPGSLFHLTPRGFRLVFLFDTPCTDRDAYVRAAHGAEELAVDALHALELLGCPGFSVDPKVAPDLARFLWRPCGTVDGRDRQAEVLVLRPTPYTVAELVPTPAPAPARPAPARGPDSDDFETAAARFNADRGQDYKTPGRRCFAHDNAGCFFPLKGSPGRWVCFSSNHPTGVGVEGRGCFTGDALDVVAWQERRPRAEVLRALGYLSDRRGSSSTNVPNVPHVGQVGQGEGQARTLPGPVLTDAKWRWLSERGTWLRDRPKARKYLLTMPSDDPHADPLHLDGMMPLGRVGMLAAAGGMGKSWALTQLALCVATGRPWLGTYPVALPGPVLLALAEEEDEEIHRRLYYGAKALGLTEEERERAARNILPLGLCGQRVALTETDNAGRDADTGLAVDLAARLKGSGVEWRLLVLDPLSRFAGADAETDNAAATRFVEALERLTQAPGGPTVMVAHHTNKTSRSAEGAGAGAGAARGSSALTDGVRWQANLDALFENGSWGAVGSEIPDLTRLKVTKSNTARKPEPLYLKRDPDNQGALLPLSPAEVRELAARTAPPRPAKKATAKEGGGDLERFE